MRTSVDVAYLRAVKQVGLEKRWLEKNRRSPENARREEKEQSPGSAEISPNRNSLTCPLPMNPKRSRRRSLLLQSRNPGKRSRSPRNRRGKAIESRAGSR